MNNLKNSVSICLPIFNEAKSIEAVIKEWEVCMKNLSLDYEIICSEDGSTDGTTEIIKNLCKNNSKIINNHSKLKRGYTNAVMSGIELASCEYILCIDSDGQCDPSDFNNFWTKRKNLDNSFLIGNRFTRQDGFFRLIISRFFKVYHKILFKNNLSDPSCPYVFFKKKNYYIIKKKLNYMREGFWWGFTASCLINNFNFHEIKINHRKRKDGETNVYKIHKIPLIAIRNAIGLLKIKID